MDGDLVVEEGEEEQGDGYLVVGSGEEEEQADGYLVVEGGEEEQGNHSCGAERVEDLKITFE